MREQLQIKKKKMIDELRELRKEYKLQNDLNSTMDVKSAYNPGMSETTTLRHKKKPQDSFLSTDISKAKFQSTTQMKNGQKTKR
jgi:hypothetical protein